ncbi:hypothetical protein PoB_000631800 [Plakobranchus ocellatus]|uniref:Uncharacterized protein n=1 Tax=Plakobranchus ocellatus TaxID=259542 RepID=A0AAV3YBJ0_9GAST|nr:hypothetical protein PoB_000631800 [Plakobranchus ocellatus]
MLTETSVWPCLTIIPIDHFLSVRQIEAMHRRTTDHPKLQCEKLSRAPSRPSIFHWKLIRTLRPHSHSNTHPTPLSFYLTPPHSHSTPPYFNPLHHPRLSLYQPKHVHFPRLIGLVCSSSLFTRI